MNEENIMDDKFLQYVINQRLKKVSEKLRTKKIDIFKYDLNYIDYLRNNPFIRFFNNYDSEQKIYLSEDESELLDTDYEAEQFVDLFYNKIGLDLNSVKVVFTHEKDFKRFRKLFLKEIKYLKELYDCKIIFKNKEFFLHTKIILKKEKEILKNEGRIYLFKYNCN